MGFFGKLLGTDKAVDIADKTISTGLTLIDNAFYTDEEKAANKQVMINAWMKAHELISKETSPKSISRRVVAWSIIGLFSLAFINGCIYISFEDYDRLDKLIEWVDRTKLGWAFCGVIGFYFLTHITQAGKG